MHAVTVGILDVNNPSNLEDQALAVAGLTLNFKGYGEDPDTVAAINVLKSVSTRCAPLEVSIVNRYWVPEPEVVLIDAESSDRSNKLTAEAMASAFKALGNLDLKIETFSGELRKQSYASVVYIDSRLPKIKNNTGFEIADISRRYEMSQRPDGGDSSSGLAAFGSVSASFVRLMKQIFPKKK